MKLIKLIALLIVFNSCKAQPKLPALTINKNDNSLLWQVSGNGLTQPSYLFGTFHLMCKNDIQFSSQLTSAVSRSEKVYMEMDMDDPATMLGGLLLMNMKEGKTLKQLRCVGPAPLAFRARRQSRWVQTFPADLCCWPRRPQIIPRPTVLCTQGVQTFLHAYFRPARLPIMPQALQL